MNLHSPSDKMSETVERHSDKGSKKEAIVEKSPRASAVGGEASVQDGEGIILYYVNFIYGVLHYFGYNLTDYFFCLMQLIQ